MSKSKSCKLIETLRTFSPEEFYNFEKIGDSQYFSKGRNYTPYIKTLKKYYPDFEGENFYRINARKYIFKKVYPSKRYNDQYMKNIFTNLIHLAEETLYQKVARGYNHQNLAFLAIEETKRNLFHLAKNNIKSLDKKLNENGIDEMYFYCKGMNEIADSVFYNKKHGRNHETGKPFTRGMHFICFSLITLALSIYNSSLRRSILGKDEDMQLNEYYAGLIDLEKFANIISSSNNTYKELILIFIYYLIHKTKQLSYTNYENMRDLLFRNYTKFNSRMLFYVSSILLNTLYENKDIIKDETFRNEYHKIALFTLKNNCYKIMKSGIFQFNKFRSYYLNALAIGEIEWVKYFRDNYVTELPAEIQNELHCIINSNIKFINNLYEEALRELRKVRFKNLYSKCDCRVLRLKIYFQKGHYLYAGDSIETFRKFLNKNLVTKNIFRGNFTTFLKYYKYLIDIVVGNEKEPLLVLSELRNTGAFPERKWLLENIEDILKNNMQR